MSRPGTGGGGGSAALGRVLVVCPTYDERDALPEVVARLRAAVPAADLLVVDDASPDGTGALADALAAADPAVHVLHRPRKDGLGRAYVAGFTWARARGYDVLVEMDADGSHAPEELPRLLDALADADLALGSRWVPGGMVHHWPWHRRLLSRGGTTWARLLLGLPVADATGGFRAYRADALAAVPLEGVHSQGYCFQVDLLRQVWAAGHRVVEVPITFTERAAGRSKMSRAIVVEALWRVTLWGVTTRRARRGRMGAARRGTPPGGGSCPAVRSPSHRSSRS